MFEYTGKVTDVYDGDTFTVMIDLGFNQFTEQSVRLYGIDTPEINKAIQKEAAITAREFVKSQILGKTIKLKTMKPKDKYGRYLAKVLYTVDVAPELDLTSELIRHGFGKTYFGEKKDG